MAQHYAEYLVNNTIQINPQFNKSSKLLNYQKAKEKLAISQETLHSFEIALKNQPCADPDSADITRANLLNDIKTATATSYRYQ